MEPTPKLTLPAELPAQRQTLMHKFQSVYLPDEGLEGGLAVALHLGQPLLLTGEPGTGKTQLAYFLASQYQLGNPLKFETKSVSVARDLFYIYDALGRFHAAQDGVTAKKCTVDYLTYHALGQAIVLTRLKEEVKDYLPRYFEHTGPKRSVVLIDEIDKAPRDFPNDILNEIEALYFRIPELGNVVIEANCEYQPIIVMTSNSEKYLPDAFLRRCTYYHIPFPERDKLEAIINAHSDSIMPERTSNSNLPKPTEKFELALNFFFILREPANGLRKKPSTIELLNWLAALQGLFKEDDPLTECPRNVLPTLGILAKTVADQHMVQRLFKEQFITERVITQSQSSWRQEFERNKRVEKSADDRVEKALLKTEVKYAGFWHRVGAATLDTIILLGYFSIGFMMWQGIAGTPFSFVWELQSTTLGSIFLPISWLIYTLLESSKWQASLGKKELKLQVTDEQNHRMRFGRANARYWSKFLSLSIVMVGYVMVAFTKKKQGLHDLIAKTLVIHKPGDKSPG